MTGREDDRRPSVEDELRAMLSAGALDLPLPGHGGTPKRHRQLFEIARQRSVSTARLSEAHVDAVSILAEAGREPEADTLYGVWASAPASSVVAEAGTITGTVPFCSGAGIIDRALVCAGDHSRPVLLDVDLRDAATMSVDLSSWRTTTLSATATGTVHFDRHPVAPTATVGAPGWYLRRPGFWHGAIGPAACWAGGTAGIVDRCHMWRDDPHVRAHRAAIWSLLWAMRAMLDHAGTEVDAHPTDALDAQRRALALRHVVERQCAEVLDRFGRAVGPRPFVTDPDIAARFSDVHLYLRQDHAERDLEALDRIVNDDDRGDDDAP